MPKPLEEVFPEKPIARLRIYAYTIDDEAHAGLLKSVDQAEVAMSRRRAPGRVTTESPLQPSRRIGQL